MNPCSEASRLQRPAVELRGAVGDIGARSVPGLHDAHGRQRPEPGTHAGPADADPLRQLPLGRKPVARFQLAPFDLAADVRNDQLRCRAIGPVFVIVKVHCRLRFLRWMNG